MSGWQLFAPNLPPNLDNARMEKTHRKLGSHQRVADHLYRYSITKKYYAVFKFHGKTKWIPLETTNREMAARRLKEEMAKFKKTDPTASLMTLKALLDLDQESIHGLALISFILVATYRRVHPLRRHGHSSSTR